MSTKWVPRMIVLAVLVLGVECRVFAQSSQNTSTDSMTAQNNTSAPQPKAGKDSATHSDNSFSQPKADVCPVVQSDKSASPTYCINKSDLGYLEPSFKGRLLRSWNYQYQILEQPAFVTVGSGNSVQIIPNPQKWLKQNSITINFAEFFPRTANLAEMVGKRYADAPPEEDGDVVKLSPDICGRNSDVLQCLAGGGSFWGRLLSGAKVTFSASERDQFQQGVVVTGLPASQSWAWTGEVDFNPASLFISGSNWSKAVTALKGMNIDAADDELACFNKDRNKASGPSTGSPSYCEKEFARPRLYPSRLHDRWSTFAGIVIPTFQFKPVSQFDFLKEGGVLVSNSGLQRSLKNFTFQWDLTRVIASVTDRIAADTIGIQTIQPIQTASKDDSKKSKLCVMYSGSAISALSVDNIAACSRIATDLHVDHYALACASTNTVDIADLVGVDKIAKPPASNCGW